MFTDPIAQVLFVSPSTNETWTFTAPDFPFLTGVTLGYEMARKAAMQLTFEAPYEEAITRLLGRGSPFALGTQVRARIGYASRPDWFTPWFGGFLNAGGDGLTLDPNGLSGQINVQVTADSANYTVSKEVVSLSGTPLDMLRAAATAMGMKFQPSKGFMEAALAQMKKKNNSWAGAPINMLTAWEAVKKIVAMLDLRMWTGPDPDDPGGSTNRLWVGTEREISLGVIYKMQHSGEPAPARPTFRVRGVIDLATSTFPCLTWAPEGGSASATWLAGGEDHAGKGVLLSYIDNDTGKVVEVQALPQAQEVATVGPIAAAQQDLKAKDAGGGELTGDSVKSDGTPAVHMSAPMPAGEIGRLRAQQEANRCQAIGNPAQKGVISSIGLPWVVPPMLVNLAGAGDIYDGPYRVEKATHTWTGGTYDLSLTCMRLGAGIDPEGEKLQTPAGAVPE